MTENDIIKDTEFKIKGILKRYYEICNTIEIFQDTIEYLKKSLQSDELTNNVIIHNKRYYEYNNDDVVVSEVLYNERHEKRIYRAIEDKRREIKAEIARLETHIDNKIFVIEKINKIMSSNQLDQNEKFLIQYCYIDKKHNNDTNYDIINKFNQGRRIILTDVRILQIRNSAISKIASQFVSVRYRLREV